MSGKSIAMGRCQSPIEQAMVAGLACEITDSFGVPFTFRKECDPPQVVGRWPSKLMVLGAQVQIASYVADIVIGQVQKHEGKPPWALVIECDGHDFHERTKEQAIRDRKRDRWMVSKGITVIRYTGREIYSNLIDCVWDAFDHALRLQNDFMIRTLPVLKNLDSDSVTA